MWICRIVGRPFGSVVKKSRGCILPNQSCPIDAAHRPRTVSNGPNGSRLRCGSARGTQARVARKDEWLTWAWSRSWPVTAGANQSSTLSLSLSLSVAPDLSPRSISLPENGNIGTYTSAPLVNTEGGSPQPAQPVSGKNSLHPMCDRGCAGRSVRLCRPIPSSPPAQQESVYSILPTSLPGNSVPPRRPGPRALSAIARTWSTHPRSRGYLYTMLHCTTPYAHLDSAALAAFASRRPLSSWTAAAPELPPRRSSSLVLVGGPRSWSSSRSS